MGFGGISAEIRSILFAVQFAAVAVAAGWFLVNAAGPRARAYQLVAAVCALLALPAAIAAPFDFPETNSGGFVALAVLAWLGAVGMAAAVYAYGTREAAAPAVGAPVGTPALAAAAAGPGPTRVEPAGVQTRVAAAPPGGTAQSDRTVVAGTLGRPAGRLAFLVDRGSDGRPFRLLEEVTIGRAREATIVIDDPEVSRSHAKIRYENCSFVLYDLGSQNGTFLRREGTRRRVQNPVPLQDADVIIMGNRELVFLDAGE